MTAQAHKDPKKEAFRLFEEGRYQESLEICTGLPAADRDAAVEILVATNLYYTEKPNDAEVCFRDLLQKMPDSSYVHSYLGKILEGRGDEGAIAERSPEEKGLGLATMSGRARMAGGVLHIWTKEGEGTLVTLRIPKKRG